jgi:connector enhancer of kinase suppressor of Ras 2
MIHVLIHSLKSFSGLDDVILPYVHFFLNNGINGRKLLSLVPDDLEKLGIFKLGHQEIILEAIDLLSALVSCVLMESYMYNVLLGTIPSKSYETSSA